MSDIILDPLSAIRHENPYGWYDALTREQPFCFDPQLKLWIAADAASVTAILEAVQLQVRPVSEPVPVGLTGTPAGEVFGNLVRMREGEYQQRLKSIIVQAMATADLRQVRQQAFDTTLCRLQRHDDINALLFTLPATVVASLCGFTNDELPEMTALIAEFVLCIPASATAEQQVRASRAAEQLLTRYADQLERVKAGTLLAALLHAAVADDWPHQAGLIANGIGLLSQTYDATAGLIGNALLAAQRFPQAFCEAPLSAFVEEVARFDAPIQNTRRFAAAPFRWRGDEIAAGDAVLLLLAAANRDPQANPQADEFIPGRADSRCFTFSHGRHRCPGQGLAVAIASGFIDALGQHNPTAIDALRCTGYRPSGNARIPELTL
ncbi:cytochrome P450 [Erwinia psidii]|uniref:Cytochrome P450 n=1 Tax=Erwinia psidii TaxID=69224 RepID=A0A3N6S3V1_9GAMM|nr:cytochrome P450 [Erwinia psidii]MCX8957637.1 cytochrome P450 [Erwinia psidii]MCX8960691.1 cytochrome P450 [Erwinia psidii]MCX8964064.1 cytochrome P450 [Erwinia psidii]RQM39547.1 cytochrome P450 [Erwinia psidii]